jgi:hypothetical protein
LLPAQENTRLGEAWIKAMATDGRKEAIRSISAYPQS